MREVRTCDFCGDEAAGTFEVVPAERDPAGEGRRMVLCPGCRETLASVLEPLLAGDGSADTGTVPDEAAGPGSGTTTVVAEPERDPDGGAGTGASTGSEPESDAGPSDRSSSPGTDGASPPSAGPETTDAAVRNDESAGEDLGEAIGGDESAETGGERRRSTRRGTPRGYRKVMRFLENREFPMDREEAETLAAEAYDMDPAAVSAAIDHAVKHNRMRDVSGDLYQ